MTQYLLIVVSAFIVAAGATPIARKVAPRFGLVDRPAARKIHTHPIPLMGGVAIYVSFIVSLILLGDRSYVQEVVSIFAGATLCSLMGLWDDRMGLPPMAKLAVQVAAAGILLLSGVRTQLPWLGPLNVLVTLLWVVGITNAVNLLDNMDGLAGGVAAVASAFFLLLAAMHRQYLVGALAAALLGASIGFLLYNVNPASVFMGDSGSLFLGFMLASVGLKLRFPGQPTTITWIIPLMVLGLPIFDTSLVFWSRLRRGLNPLTTPGTDHTSHRLVRMGYTRREAVLILHLASCALGVLAMYLTQSTAAEALVISLAVVVIALLAMRWLERYAVASPESAAQPSVLSSEDKDEGSQADHARASDQKGTSGTDRA